MPPPVQHESMTIDDVASRCAVETDRFFAGQPHDSRYCFELWRRAIEERQERAWSLVFAQYRPLVIGWAQRHPSFGGCGEEPQYVCNAAFTKLWAAVTPARFAGFADLRSLLRYLQMCVHSAIADLVRTNERMVLLSDQEDLARAHHASAGQLTRAESVVEPEEQVLDHLESERLWQEIQVRLRDEREWIVVRASFVLNLKPREILVHYQEHFGSIREIYRIKENVLERLRRDRDLLRIVAECAGNPARASFSGIDK